MLPVSILPVSLPEPNLWVNYDATSQGYIASSAQDYFSWATEFSSWATKARRLPPFPLAITGPLGSGMAKEAQGHGPNRAVTLLFA
jgi:hypothetical protein